MGSCEQDKRIQWAHSEKWRISRYIMSMICMCMVHLLNVALWLQNGKLTKQNCALARLPGGIFDVGEAAGKMFLGGWCCGKMTGRTSGG